MQSLDLPSAHEVYQELFESYSERHRHYHTVNHIDDCLQKLDWAKHLANDARAIEIAIWFHDAIYKPFSSSNELDSANWAWTFLSQQNISQSFVDLVHRLIMATLHNAQNLEHDALLLVDIDLSILGEQEESYQQFEKDVRKEYRWVPSLIYRKKRCDILSSFVARERIFSNQDFFDRYEERARINLGKTIKMLGREA